MPERRKAERRKTEWPNAGKQNGRKVHVLPRSSEAPVHPENTAMYSASNGGRKICGVFSETAPLQRSSTAPLKAYVRSAIFCEKHACALLAFYLRFQGLRTHVAPTLVHSLHYIVQILLLVELLLIKYSKVVPRATIYKITKILS